MKLRPIERLLLLTFWLAGPCIGIAHADDPVKALGVCAKMTDRDARLACYDELGKSVLDEESAAEQTPQEVGVETVAAGASAVTEATGPTIATAPEEGATDIPSLPDNLGGTSFERGSEEGAFKHRGLVTSCQIGADGRWFFFFENGQIWKQSNRSRQRFKECHFFVTITRDGFGYKMQIDGKTSKIRVARKK